MDRIGDIADLRCTDLDFYPGFIQLKGKIFVVYHYTFLTAKIMGTINIYRNEFQSFEIYINSWMFKRRNIPWKSSHMKCLCP